MIYSWMTEGIDRSLALRFLAKHGMFVVETSFFEFELCWYGKLTGALQAGVKKRLGDTIFEACGKTTEFMYQSSEQYKKAKVRTILK